MLPQVVIELFKRNGYLVFFIDQKLVIVVFAYTVIFCGIPYLAWKPLRIKIHLEQNICFKGLSCIVGRYFIKLALELLLLGIVNNFWQLFRSLLLHLLLSYSLVASTLS